jgi:uncharacterized cupin superfamily protein
MGDRRHPRVVNLDEVEARAVSKGSRFGAKMKSLGRASEAQTLGCTHYEIEPGRTAFPLHFHCINAEAIFVLDGEGTLRVGEATVALRTGDWVTIPPGPKYAHQLTNTGSAPLRYLCVSTLKSADIVGYPDSKKVAAVAGESYASAMRGEQWVRIFAREGSTLDYYDGEAID